MANDSAYMPQKNEVPEETMENALARCEPESMRRKLKKIGIVLDENGNVPKSGGAPRIFMVKDGKVRTLEEEGVKFPSPEFLEAVLKGQMFAYPAGERRPVQMQIDSFGLDFSDPLEVKRIQEVKLDPPEEPARKPKPKWYHKMFSFLPGNRRKIEEYESAERAHAEWERKIEEFGKNVEERTKNLPEQYAAAVAIDEMFGATRNEKTFAPEREIVEEFRRNQCREIEKIYREHIAQEDLGIEIMANVYARHPKLREDWVKNSESLDTNSKGLYTKKSFDKLTTADIDPTKVLIGGKSLSEQEFATLAMFAATDADIGVAAQKASVGDPTGVIQFYQQEGYSEAQAKQIIADSICASYTADILHIETRMYKYFDTAVNGGRAKAAEALKAYPGDKKPLAQILGRAVKCAGTFAGASTDSGVPGMMKVSGEMLSLMERDPELKALAKQSFEREEKAFCEGTRFPELSFDKMVDTIRKRDKFSELLNKGKEARAEFMKARAEGKELTSEEKKGYLRDILTANLAEGMFKSQLEATKKEKISPEGTAFNYAGLDAYCDKLGEKIENANETLAVSTGGGSSLPSSAHILLSTAMENRVVKAPGVLTTVADKEKLADITYMADEIIATDQLAEKSMDYLFDRVADTGNGDEYAPSKIMAKAAAKIEELEKQRGQEKTAAINDPKLENNAAKPQAAAPGM